MEEKIKDNLEQAAAFQKMWMDTMSGVSRVWGTYSPEKPPPEQLKDMRNQTFRAMSSSWEEFMKTPQFMQVMRDSMNNGMAWKAASKDGINRMHDSFQTVAKKDVDGVLLAIRHVEKRVLDRIETLQDNISELEADLSKLNKGGSGKMQDAFQQEVIRRLEQIEENMKASAPASKTAAKTKAPAPKKVAARKTTAAKTTGRK